MHEEGSQMESKSPNQENETEPTPIPVGKSDEVIGRPSVPASAREPVEPDMSSDIDPKEWHEDDEWRPSDQAEDA
jgi:hypothetical protein